MRKRKKLLFAVLTCLMIFACGAITVFAADGGKEYVPKMYSSFWALVPPIVAIGLALITKEVYSSLFVGIAIGGIFWSNFHFEKAVLHIFEDGIVGVLTDSYNMGILVFLVILGIMVCMMNNAGGSAAFGRWASIHIKTRVGAQLATIVLGILIFIDDYFNCLTVGSVMRPITDKHNVSRAKLAYLIDATAAPVCIIAPISSWAAAVTGFVKGEDGFSIFMRAIPYNYYALLTILAMVLIVVLKIDYGPMKLHEDNAVKGDIYTTPDRPYANAENEIVEEKGKVIDLVFPIVVLIIFCICGMLYTGGFFSGTGFVKAFSASDASVGLMLGSFFALVDSEQLDIGPINAKTVPAYTTLGMKILKEVNEKIPVKHPELDINTVDLVEFYGPTPNPDKADMRNVVIFGDAQADRSPCGTGTSAKLATLYKWGEIGVGEPFVYESFMGSLFKGEIKEVTKVADYDAVVPKVTGSCYLTGVATYLIDGKDPLKYGFLIG